MAILAVFMSVNLISCSSGGDDDVIVDVTDDYGKITKNDFVATGGYRDVKPLRATILASINTVYQGAYTSMGIEFTPHQPNFNSSETQSVRSYSGVTNGHFETILAGDDEGYLEPGTTYYYRAYVYVAGTRYNGDVRSFDTPDLELSKENLVDLGLSVKWASCNMGANAPETIGTLLQQRFAIRAFNYDVPDHLMDVSTGKSRFFLPDGVNDDNWLGNSSYDVATRTMGSSYRIPTEEEWQELEDECRWTSGVCNGVKGFYVSDKKDGTSVIFLPYVKKSSKHDITVYLSAPDDIISYIRDAQKENDYYFLYKSTAPVEQWDEIDENYQYAILQIEKRMSVGEVLTENSHIYCDYGLLLSPWDGLSYSEFTWTHPITDKDYNFSDSDVLGGGVLYVRAVSNR